MTTLTLRTTKNYGTYMGEPIAEMSRERLLELVLRLGNENDSLRNSPCLHDQAILIKNRPTP